MPEENEGRPQDDSKKPTRHDAREAKKAAKEAARQEQIKAAKRAKMKKQAITAGIILLVIAGIGYAMVALGSQIRSTPLNIGPVGSTHEHSDFKVYLRGEELDFSLPKYQVRARYVHVEGGIGEIVHKHATGVTWAHFFESVGMAINSTCFVDDAGRAFCNNPATNETLKFYVNGKLSNDVVESYEMRDLDRVLVSYGNETEEVLDAQLKSVTNRACIESRKPCPQR